MRGLSRDKTKAEAFNVFIFFTSTIFLILLFWWHNNLWGWRKRENEFRNLCLSFCQSARSLLPFLGCKKWAASVSIYRCSSTCWHLKTPALIQIHRRTKKPKTNGLFNQLSSSRASWLSWKLCDFESICTRSEFHRSQLRLYFCVIFFSQSEDSEKFQILSHVRRWPRHIRTSEIYKNLPADFIGFKNHPTGYCRDLQTSGQSMYSNERLAIETSIKV